MYELLIFIVLSTILECGAGILYGVGIGYDPIMVFSGAIIFNFIGVIIAVFVIDLLFAWKKGIKVWIERRLGRGQRIINKYGSIGIVMGVMVLSPIQLAVVGKLFCMEPKKLYPSLLVAICVVALAYLAIALGIFKFLLKW